MQQDDGAEWFKAWASKASGAENKRLEPVEASVEAEMSVSGVSMIENGQRILTTDDLG